MRKVLLIISNIYLSMFLVLMAMFSLGALVLTIVGKVNPAFEFIPFVYLVFGFIFVPAELLIRGSVGQMSPDVFSTVMFILSPIIFVLSIILLVYKLKSTKENEHRRKYYKIASYILLILFLAVFVINFIFIILCYFKIDYDLSAIDEYFVKLKASAPVITAYTNVLPQFIVAFVFAFVVALCYKKPTQKAVKVYGTINFYSDEYAEPQNEVELKKEEVVETTESNGIKESSEEAKDLIHKIMQLEELRSSGQISDVEYTKLRQKAIKRYKR